MVVVRYLTFLRWSPSLTFSRSKHCLSATRHAAPLSAHAPSHTQHRGLCSVRSPLHTEHQPLLIYMYDFHVGRVCGFDLNLTVYQNYNLLYLDYVSGCIFIYLFIFKSISINYLYDIDAKRTLFFFYLIYECRLHHYS